MFNNSKNHISSEAFKQLAWMKTACSSSKSSPWIFFSPLVCACTKTSSFSLKWGLPFFLLSWSASHYITTLQNWRCPTTAYMPSPASSSHVECFCFILRLLGFGECLQSGRKESSSRVWNTLCYLSNKVLQPLIFFKGFSKCTQSSFLNT